MKEDKLLFILPAYNEEKNLEKVIQEIRKDGPKNSDILVVNDCSTDETASIAKKNGVICLTNPFNLRYAMALQVGFKYAKMNNYDYVVQFDADGQHVAEEVKKLVRKMNETNADIVIGSRFLENTEYKHPLFRMIGTKTFSFLIKMFCRKKITDPTSGMQLLNKK